MNDWKKTSEEKPTYYRPVLTNGMASNRTARYTPDGWDCIGKEPESWKYEFDPTYEENQFSINEWQEQTFGKPSRPEIIVRRLLEEVVELAQRFLPAPAGELLQEDVDSVLHYLRPGDEEGAILECADVGIVLKQLAGALNFDLRGAEDTKMEVNRSRKWRLTGDGRGYHE